MFGLIPMVITIILAGLITGAVAYLGGDIFTSSSVKANANTFINEASQVRSASQLFRVNEAAWPSAVTDLTSATPSYLSSTPSVTYTIDAGTGYVTYAGAEINDDICLSIQDSAGDASGTLPTAEPAGELFGCWVNTGTNTFFHK